MSSSDLYPSEENIQERVEMIDQLKSFLLNAPKDQQQTIKQHHTPTGDTISCVRHNNEYFISGTDIVRAIVFRFKAFGRPITQPKKFEEGVFSDLRNLKPGTDSILEEPKSAFLDLLFKNNCIRTQKKQKVFYWYSVPHDRLFLDALERDLKREKVGVEPTSRAVAQPAVAISLDTTQAMFDEFRKSLITELNLELLYKKQSSTTSSSKANIKEKTVKDIPPTIPRTSNTSQEGELQRASTTIFGQFSLFEGSPTYKQRRRRVTQQEPPKGRAISSSPIASLSSKIQQGKEQDTTLTSCKSIPDSEPSLPASSRTFSCPLKTCGKIFKRLEHMKRHLRTHTMERPYLCDLCGKRFSRSDNLAQHKKTHKRSKSMSVHDRSRVRREDEDQDEDEYDDNSSNHSSDEDSTYRLLPRRRAGSNNGHYKRRKMNHGSDTKHLAVNQALDGVTTRTRSRLSVNHSLSNSRQQAYSQQLYVRTDIQDAEALYHWSHHFEDNEEEEIEAEADECIKTLIVAQQQQQTNQQQQQQQQQQYHDTNMMLVEEMLPTSPIYEQEIKQEPPSMQHVFSWEDNSSANDDWRGKIDWNQYSLPASPTNIHTYTSQDLHYKQSIPTIATPPDIYLCPSDHYAPSNSSSCLASPISTFLMTPNSFHSTATTVVNSPIIKSISEENYYYPPPTTYYSDESPTMSPTDALLQH